LHSKLSLQKSHDVLLVKLLLHPQPCFMYAAAVGGSDLHNLGLLQALSQAVQVNMEAQVLS
jgi:hypothetical protein